ncbi:MAG: amidohydrolase family protein [Clostridiales bacterium]|nr:amidohydrolase family protein [Candidatus Blautia equi]
MFAKKTAEKCYALINGIILDGSEDMVPQKNKVILIKGKMIENVVSKGYDLTGYEIIDLKGQYVLPGLINLHVHLAGSGRPKNNSADAKRLVKLITSNPVTNLVGKMMVAGFARTQLFSGTTTIRTVGGISNYDTTIRDLIKAEKCVGPRILAANMAISVPGGHMAGSLAYEAHTPEEAAHYVDVIAKDHPDIIKLMITGGVSDAEKEGEPGVLRMSPEIVKAAADRAHELGYQVAAHVESTEGVRVALENGVDSIEHGAAPTEDIIRLFKEKGAFQVSTISPALPFALFEKEMSGVTPVMKENGKIVFEGIVGLARECLNNGIPVGLGTDTACPYVTQYDMWRELAFFMKYCGVSSTFAIYSATKLNARLAGIDHLTGSIEPGKMADLITVGDNPLKDISLLRHLNMVMFEGKIYHSKVKKIKTVETELDKYL